MVNTNSGYLTYFSNANKLSSTGSGGTGATLMLIYSLYSVDGKNISKYDPNLSAYWDMETISNGLLKDFSKNGNDARIHGTTSVGGKIGNARSFNGISDYTVTSSN